MGERCSTTQTEVPRARWNVWRMPASARIPPALPPMTTTLGSGTLVPAFDVDAEPPVDRLEEADAVTGQRLTRPDRQSSEGREAFAEHRFDSALQRVLEIDEDVSAHDQ